MRYGLPSLIEFNTVEEHLRFCGDHGFDFFEINLSFPWFQSDQLKAEELIALKERYGVSYSIHLHDQVNPFDFSPELRSGSVHSVQYALDLAKAIGAKRLTMHLVNGMYASSNGTKVYAYEVCKDRYLEQVRSFIALCSRQIGDSDTIFCIENTSGFLPFQEEAIDLMLKRSCFGLTFDVGHSYRAGARDERFILDRSEHVKHMHLHDVREKGNHYALGAGLLDIAGYVELANRLQSTCVIEVKERSAVLQSLSYLASFSAGQDGDGGSGAVGTF